MRRIKNREIFLVQIATRPVPKHIYRSLRALLNSTLTRNEFGSFQTQTIHKIEGSKPCIYTFYTKTRQIHTIVQKSTLFHTELNNFHTHIVYIQIFIVPYKTILKFHTCDLRFPLILSFFLFSSPLLSVFALPFSKTKMRYFFWSSLYLILSPFYFTFFSLLEHP